MKAAHPRIGDDLAIDRGIVTECSQRSCDRRKPSSEIFAIAREQSNLAGRLHADGAITVEFEFVRPGRSFGQFGNRHGEHRLDESDPALLGFHLLRVSAQKAGGHNRTAISAAQGEVSPESMGKSIFSRREPARRETGPPRSAGNDAEQNRLKACRGKPFDLWKELTFESQKGNSRKKESSEGRCGSVLIL